MSTSAGGMDITVAGAASGEDLDITANSSINITSTENTESAIYLRANGGTDETIKIHSDQGTGEDSVTILSDAGGIDIDAAQGRNVDIQGGQVLITSKADADNTGLADAIKLLTPAGAGGGAADTISITNTQGTGAQALHLNAAAGGIDIDSADMIDIDAADEITINTTSADGHIAITSAHTEGDSILISANADAGAVLDVDAGVMDVDVQGAYTLDATGISLDSDAASNFSVATGAAAEKDLTVAVTGGGDSSLIMTSDGTGADAVTLSATAGSMLIGSALAQEKTLTLGNTASTHMLLSPSATAGNEKILIKNATGDTEATATDGAIKIESTAGGISLDAELDIHLSAAGGNIMMDDGTTTIFDFNTASPSLIIYDDADTSSPRDYFKILVGAKGKTEISTNDDANAPSGDDADLWFSPDGSLRLNTGTGFISFHNAEDAANSSENTRYGDFQFNGADMVYRDGNGDSLYTLKNVQRTNSDAKSILVDTNKKLEFRLNSKLASKWI